MAKAFGLISKKLPMRRRKSTKEETNWVEFHAFCLLSLCCKQCVDLFHNCIVLLPNMWCVLYLFYWFKWQYPATNINCKLYIHRMEAASITSRQFKLNYVELRKLTHVLLDRLTEIMSISSSSATPIYRKLHFKFPWSKRFTTVLGSLNIYIRVNSIERLVNILSKNSFL